MMYRNFVEAGQFLGSIWGDASGDEPAGTYLHGCSNVREGQPVYGLPVPITRCYDENTSARWMDRPLVE